jgi:CheY-like chemotaxis protein
VLVRLPTAEATGPPPTPVGAAPRGPLRILLVDDEHEVRRALAAMLVADGHTVLMAATGADALRELERGDVVDLVLTDLVMPAMTGRELAQVIKARWPSLPVGLISGWGQLPDADATDAIDFVLPKPLTLEALAAAVAHLAR